MKRELRLPLTVEGRLDRALADALGVGRAAVKHAFAAGDVRVGALRAQLAARTVEKVYLALVAGRVPSGGVCSVALAPRGGRVVAVPDPVRPPKASGKPREAETRYEV